MEPVRQGLNVHGDIGKTLPTETDLLAEFNCRIGELLVPPFQVERQHHDSLIHIVVQCSGYPSALLFMGFNQSAPKIAKSFFGKLAIGHVYAGSDVAVKGP